jgi:hypothetical protein
MKQALPSNIKTPALSLRSRVLTSLYTSLPCNDYMLQERNHLSSSRRYMKKQTEYLNGIYGRDMGIVGSAFRVQI